MNIIATNKQNVQHYFIQNVDYDRIHNLPQLLVTQENPVESSNSIHD